MRRRFWVALLIGLIAGGGAVASFAPYVRARVEEEAARLGAEVVVRRIVPTWEGLELRGVSVALRRVPGVRLWLDRVVVDWRARRPKSIVGGRVVAVGALAALARDFEAWRAETRGAASGGDQAGARVDVAASGFELDWRAGSDEGTDRVHAEGVAISRHELELVLSASTVAATRSHAHLRATDARVVVRRVDGRTRIGEVSTSELELIDAERHAARGSGDAAQDAAGQADAVLAAGRDRAVPSASSATPSHDARAAAGSPVATATPSQDGSAASVPSGTGGEGVRVRVNSGGNPPSNTEHPRVAAARRAYRALVSLAGRVDEFLASDARVNVRGARAKLTIGGEPLDFGPGTLGIGREAERLVVALEPEVRAPQASSAPRARSAGGALTFTARVPLPAADGEPAIVAELRGGPVWLSTLGLRDGDLGLRNVDKASLESDGRVEIPKDGRSIALRGSGRLRDLAIAHPRLAAEPLEGVELAWHGGASIALDGTRVALKKTEVDLGSVRLVLDGTLERRGDDLVADLRYDAPLVTCQQAFDSLPRALVSELAGMTFSGSLSLTGHARFDTARLAATFDVNWGGTLGCRITSAPEALNPRRFKVPFQKTIYTPNGEPKTMEFGPGTPSWVPYGSIGSFMETAVLTCEDGRFARHEGFDQEAIVNSIRENLGARRFKRGASTISMQLAKNLYLTRDKTVARKLKEAILTVYLEQELTKAEMMGLYLNVIEYGPMVYGIGPAARHYFQTSAGAMSLGQAMYLGSILQNPKRQFFGAGGRVEAGRMGYLHQLMKIANKIHRVSDEELDVGLRETVVFGSPEPHREPPSSEASADGVSPAARTAQEAPPATGG